MTTTTVCPSCGQESPAPARFCSACGAAIEARAPANDERRVVTVIFVDLVGFTARAEQLDPEDVRAVLTPYHDRVRREIESFGGIVEKFIGDAVMGIFGAPLAHGDDAERAVRAALVVRDSAGELADGGLEIRIAVNTGEAVVSLGARPALGESMVAGDVVNTAARLQAAAPVNGVVVGDATYRATRSAIGYERTEPVTAKGKEHPIAAWIAVEPLTAAGERRLSELPIIGRSRELTVLDALWERVAVDRLPHLVSLFGPAGVGKSTLAAEVKRTLEAAGASVLRGRSLPYRESGTYGAFATQIMQLAGVFESDDLPVASSRLRAAAVDLLGDTGADAARVAADLGVMVGLDAAPEAADRDALFESALQFVEAAARRRPTVLIFEDAHWADPNLLDLIEMMACRAHDLPLLCLALARPELLDTRPNWGAGVPAYVAMTLPPLGDEQARELALRRLGSADQADEVVRVADGNPLFIEQLAASIGELRPGSLPTTIREIVAARLDALAPEARALLLDAAVVGKVFWIDALRALAENGGDVSRLLEVLERRDLIRRDPSSIIEGQQQYAFTHGLIRDVAYDLLPRADRARRHGLVAEFFGSRTGISSDAIGAIALHWREAGDHVRAVEQLIHAAEIAERGWAKDHAAALYREAFVLVPAEDRELKSTLRRRLAIAASASFHLEDVVRPAGSQPA